MPPLWQPLVDFALSSGPAIVLSLGLPILLLAIWRARPDRPTEHPNLDYLGLAVTSLLVVALLQLPFWLYLERYVADAIRYVAPLDRLFTTVLLAALAVALTGSVGARRWRSAMIGCLAAATLAWAGWAPIWASEMAAVPPTLSDPTGIARPWDFALAALAFAFAAVLAARKSRPPAWVFAVPGILAVGSLLDALGPAPVTGAVGARSAQLALGLMFGLVATRRGTWQGLRGSSYAARERLLRLAGTRLRTVPATRATRLTRSTLPTNPAPASAPVAVRRLASPAESLGEVAIVDDALVELTDSLGAASAMVVLRRGDDIEIWARAAARRARRLGRMPLSEFPTIARAMSTGSLSVPTYTHARDIEALYVHLGSPDAGEVHLTSLGGSARGAVLAGRAFGAWPPDALRRIGALAARLDDRLAAVERHGAAGDSLDRVLGALEAQSATLHRLGRQVDQLDGRIGVVEGAVQHAGPARPGAGGFPTPVAAPGRSANRRGRPINDGRADRAYAARLEAFEHALARVPWGVLVTERDGTIVFANAAARTLFDAPRPEGRDLAALAVEPDALADIIGLLDPVEVDSNGLDEDALDAIPEQGEAVARCMTGGLVVEAEVLRSPGLGPIGLLVIVAPEEAIDHDPEHAAGMLVGDANPDQAPALLLIPDLADALREPMKAIMTHRDVLARRPAFAEPELSRHIGSVDAQLGRLDVRLTDLLTALEISTGHYRLATGLLDVEELIDAALERSRSLFQDKGLRAQRQLADALPAVRGDRRALSHVLDNLLATAVDRSAHGAVITISARPRTVTVPAKRAGIQDAREPILVISVQYRDWWYREVAERVFAIGEGPDDTPALRVARLLTEVQGGRAWGEHLGEDGRLLLNVGLPTS